MFWANPKDPDVRDRYGAVVDPKWLDGESIINATFTVDPESGLTISNLNWTIIQGQVSALFDGGVVGFHPVLIRIETPTRQMERTVVLWVKDN